MQSPIEASGQTEEPTPSQTETSQSPPSGRPSEAQAFTLHGGSQMPSPIHAVWWPAGAVRARTKHEHENENEQKKP